MLVRYAPQAGRQKDPSIGVTVTPAFYLDLFVCQLISLMVDLSALSQNVKDPRQAIEESAFFVGPH